MLWRANLFIDETKVLETGADSGIADWNNENRWTFDQGNEWDRDWEDVDNDGIFNEPGPYNGGQYAIKPWTHYDDDSNVFTTLPYSQGCADSVEHFNIDMDSQAATLTALGTVDVDVPTLAPIVENQRLWSNYAFGEQIGEGTERIYNRLEIPADSENFYYPYAPGFATASDPYAPHLTGYAAGVHCYGFVQRSLAYDNNRYRIPEVGGRLEWGSTTPGLIGWQTWQNQSWAFPTNLPSMLVPGDILVMTNHVALVTGIVYNNNTREYTVGNVQIMDSNGVNWCVEKRRWSNLPVLVVYRPIYE